MMPPPQVRDPDLFLDSVIVERSQGRLGGPRVVEADAVFVAARKAALWDPKTNVRAMLAMGARLSAEDLCRLTGQTPESVALALAELEGKREVRRVEGGMWKRVSEQV